MVVEGEEHVKVRVEAWEGDYTPLCQCRERWMRWTLSHLSIWQRWEAGQADC